MRYEKYVKHTCTHTHRETRTYHTCTWMWINRNIIIIIMIWWWWCQARVATRISILECHIVANDHLVSPFSPHLIASHTLSLSHWFFSFFSSSYFFNLLRFAFFCPSQFLIHSFISFCRSFTRTRLNLFFSFKLFSVFHAHTTPCEPIAFSISELNAKITALSHRVLRFDLGLLWICMW